MIAASFHEFPQCGWDIVYYASSTFYPEEKQEDIREIKRKWWEYLDAILIIQITGSVNIIEVLVKPIRHITRISHERQYPRIVKYRNNKNP